MAESILIVSGKGGVGKSVIAANLGAALASAGRSTVIIDADIGLRSQDTLLGLENLVVYDLIDAVNKECTISEALHDCPSCPGLKLLPASQFARVRDLDRNRFRKMINTLKQDYEYILIDAPAGIEKGFRNLLNAQPDRILLVTTPDQLCIRDAERAAQVIEAKQLPRPELIVNRLENELIRRKEMLSARVIADTLDLPLAGEIPDDPVVYRSVLRNSLFINYDCEARLAVLRIAERLHGSMIPFPEIGKQRITLRQRLFPRIPKEVTPLDRH